MAPTKTIAFFGASTGIGLSALKHTLAEGHRCVALCRYPSKLTDVLPPQSYPNLQVVEGNAHDITSVSRSIRTQDGNLVDAIVSTIGAKPDLAKLSIDDPNVCRKGVATLLEALAQLRRDGATGKPRIIVASTTGMSRFGRDTPLVIVPVYSLLLKVPHEDKRIMEDSLTDSGEDFTIVRSSYLVNGESDSQIRVGVEDPKKGVEQRTIGYTISREDAGKWVAENLLLKEEDTKYLNKTASITY